MIAAAATLRCSCAAAAWLFSRHFRRIDHVGRDASLPVISSSVRGGFEQRFGGPGDGVPGADGTRGAVRHAAVRGVPGGFGGRGLAGIGPGAFGGRGRGRNQIRGSAYQSFDTSALDTAPGPAQRPADGEAANISSSASALRSAARSPFRSLRQRAHIFLSELHRQPFAQSVRHVFHGADERRAERRSVGRSADRCSHRRRSIRRRKRC